MPSKWCRLPPGVPLGDGIYLAAWVLLSSLRMPLFGKSRYANTRLLLVDLMRHSMWSVTAYIDPHVDRIISDSDALEVAYQL